MEGGKGSTLSHTTLDRDKESRKRWTVAVWREGGSHTVLLTTISGGGKKERGRKARGKKERGRKEDGKKERGKKERVQSRSPKVIYNDSTYQQHELSSRNCYLLLMKGCCVLGL